MPESNELSEREQEILRLVATGASNKEIAQQLTISTNTVKVHVRNIFAKIGAVSRTEAAMYAVKAGLVPGGPAPSGIDASPVQQTQSSQPSNRISKRVVWLVSLLGLVTLFAIGLVALRTLSPSSQPVTTPQAVAEPHWQEFPSMPTPRFGLGAAVYEGMIYTVGGEDRRGVTGLVQRYDPARLKWEDLQEKPTPVSDIQAAVLGGNIFVPGGVLPSGEISDVLEVYDPRQDTWTRLASLPSPLSAYALAAFEGKLYLFGGWDGQKYRDSVYRYEPGLNTWMELTPMPTRRAYASAAVSGREIFVLGGTDGKNALDVNEVFSPDLSDTPDLAWKNSASLPDARFAMGASSVAETIYIIGGMGDSIQFPSIAFFPQTGEWQSLEEPPLEVGSNLGIANLGMSLFALGGKVANAPTGTNLAYKAMYTISIPLITK